MRDDILKKAIESYGEDKQVDMCLEEMSELAKALLKLRRSDEQEGLTMVARLADVLEELADVQIMLDQMRIIYGSTEAEEETKLRRLAERLGIRWA